MLTRLSFFQQSDKDHEQYENLLALMIEDGVKNIPAFIKAFSRVLTQVQNNGEPGWDILGVTLFKTPNDHARHITEELMKNPTIKKIICDLKRNDGDYKSYDGNKALLLEEIIKGMDYALSVCKGDEKNTLLLTIAQTMIYGWDRDSEKNRLWSLRKQVKKSYSNIIEDIQIELRKQCERLTKEYEASFSKNLIKGILDQTASINSNDITNIIMGYHL